MSKQTVAQIVTDKMIKALEEGTVPWHKSWNAGGFPMSMSTGKPYRGFNLFVLSMADFTSKWWGTSNHINKLGGRVKYDEWKKGTPIHFWKFIKDKENFNSKKNVPLHRFFNVYNLDQCEGLPDKVLEKFQTKTTNNDNEEITTVENIFDNMKNKPSEVPSTRASYTHSTDTVKMPPLNTFDNTEEYYSTRFHEYVHSTGHEARVGRKGIIDQTKFGSSKYSKEELVAEAGAAMLCEMTNIKGTFDNSAAYIKSWLKKLKDDPRILISAFGEAQKAIDYIVGTEF